MRIGIFVGLCVIFTVISFYISSQEWTYIFGFWAGSICQAVLWLGKSWDE